MGKGIPYAGVVWNSGGVAEGKLWGLRQRGQELENSRAGCVERQLTRQESGCDEGGRSTCETGFRGRWFLGCGSEGGEYGAAFGFGAGSL